MLKDHPFSIFREALTSVFAAVWGASLAILVGAVLGIYSFGGIEGYLFDPLFAAVLLVPAACFFYLATIPGLVIAALEIGVIIFFAKTTTLRIEACFVLSFLVALHTFLISAESQHLEGWLRFALCTAGLLLVYLALSVLDALLSRLRSRRA